MLIIALILGRMARMVWSSIPTRITSSTYGVRKCSKTQRRNYTIEEKR